MTIHPTATYCLPCLRLAPAHPGPVFDEAHARALGDALDEALKECVATKSDIARLRHQASGGMGDDTASRSERRGGLFRVAISAIRS